MNANRIKNKCTLFYLSKGKCVMSTQKQLHHEIACLTNIFSLHCDGHHVVQKKLCISQYY